MTTTTHSPQAQQASIRDLRAQYSCGRRFGRTSLELLPRLQELGATAGQALEVVLIEEREIMALEACPALLPGWYFELLAQVAMVYGAAGLVADIETATRALQAEGEGLKHEGRLAPSLSPFAKGMVYLAAAVALRGKTPNQTQKIFGLDGPAHAAGLRQALVSTENRQANFARASLQALQMAPAEAALEAWRALQAWALAMPGPRTLAGAFKLGELPLGVRNGHFVDLAQGQFFLDPLVLDSPWNVDVFKLGRPLEPEGQVLMKHLLKASKDTESSDRLAPAHLALPSWVAMSGPAAALELVNGFTTGVLMDGVPFNILQDSAKVRRHAWVPKALADLLQDFVGTPQEAAAIVLVAGLLEEWERLEGATGSLVTDQMVMPLRYDLLAEVVSRPELIRRAMPLLLSPHPVPEAVWLHSEAAIRAILGALAGCLQTTSGPTLAREQAGLAQELLELSEELGYRI